MKSADGLYGTVLMLAVLLGLSEDAGAGPGKLLGAVAVTMVVYWVVHVYAGTLAERVAHPDRRLRPIMREVMHEEWPLVEAAAVPAIPLLLGALGVLSRDTALWAAVILGLVDLFAWGLSVGRALRQSTVITVAIGAANVGLGLVMVGLKYLIK